MVKSQFVLSYLLVITALLLSACASTNTAHHAQSAGVAVAPNSVMFCCHQVHSMNLKYC